MVSSEQRHAIKFREEGLLRGKHLHFGSEEHSSECMNVFSDPRIDFHGPPRPDHRGDERRGRPNRFV